MLYCTPSDSYGCRPLFSVRIQLQTKPLPNWRSGLSIHPNHQLWNGWMAIYQPVSIGQVVSGSPSGSITRFIWGSCLCRVIIVSYQNRVCNSQQFIIPWFAVCNIDYFGIRDFRLIDCISAYQGGQYFCQVLEDLCGALITTYARPNIIDAPLTLIFRMQWGACWCCFCP